MKKIWALLFLFCSIGISYGQIKVNQDTDTISSKTKTNSYKEYLHKNAILIGVEMPPEAQANYRAISLPEAILFAIQHLEGKRVKNIKICETQWIAAPVGAFLIDGKGDFSLGEKHYSTFRIGVFDGSEKGNKAGKEFVFIARGEGDNGTVFWYPEQGPGYITSEDKETPESVFDYEYLNCCGRANFEKLSVRFK